MPAKRRKHSDLTVEETATVVNLLKRFQEEIYDEEENEPGVREAVTAVLKKLSEVKHIPFSDATVLTLTKAGISIAALEWKTEGKPQAQDLGHKKGTDALHLDETTKLIRYIRKHVAFETEAGCRILINAIMMHATTNLDTADSGVAIAPEFRIDRTTLESGGSSYVGVVDYLMVLGRSNYRDQIVLSPQFAFTNEQIYKSLSCTIYEAKPEKTMPALPQVAMRAAIQCQRLGLTTFRGCVTTGEEWLFFVYNRNTDGAGGRVSYVPAVRLEADLNGLPLVLGLLYDWIVNGHQRTLEFFDYLL